MKALVLSGGGSAGSYHAGVCLGLAELGHRYDAICGVSVGSIAAAYLAQYDPEDFPEAAERFADLFSRLETSQVLRSRPAAPLSYMWSPSLYDSSPLRKLLTDGLDVDRILSSRTDLRMGAVSLDSGGYRSFHKGDPIVPSVMASAAYPIAFPPEVIYGERWSDGGLRHVVPLADAVRLGATEIHVSVAMPPEASAYPRNPSIVDYSLRSLDIMLDEIVAADFESCFEATTTTRPDDYIVKNPLKFVPSEARKAIETGRTDALKVFG